MDKNFIITNDKDEAIKLEKAGFEKIENNIPNVFTFLNTSKLSFDKTIDITKIRYSNILCF